MSGYIVSLLSDEEENNIIDECEKYGVKWYYDIGMGLDGKEENVLVVEDEEELDESELEDL